MPSVLMSLLLPTSRYQRAALSVSAWKGLVLLCLGVGISLLLNTPTARAQDSDDAVFVRADATTDPGNEDIGDSWENAYASLSSALQNLEEEEEIWLAQGTYLPTDTPNDRDSSFVITSDTKIFGGFEGVEENFGERPTPVDPSSTVLSGDIDGNGALNGNSYHVVVFDDVTNSTRLDGVAITGGNANTSGNKNGGGVQCRNLCLPLLENVIIEGNYADENGGGIHLLSEGAQVAPTLRNVIIRGNEAGQSGGGLHLEGAAPGALATIRVANTVLKGNRATEGGGLTLEGIPPATVVGEFYNTTIHGNAAADTGGGVYHRIRNGSLLFTNSILAGNEAGSSGNEVFQDGSVAADFEASLIRGAFEGGGWDNTLGTNVNANTGAPALFAEATNPQNAPTTQGDVRLNWASPAIDRGIASLIPSDPQEETEPFYEKDLAGNDRVLGNELDMGAYEGGITPTDATLFVDSSAGDDTGGSDWANPYRTLQGALQALHNARAAAADGVDVGSLDGEVAVWVAEGTYTPDDGPGFQSGDTPIPPEVASFVIPDGVRVLGGFSGGETDASQRNPDPATNNTVLSGELEAETNSNMVAVLDAPVSGAIGAALRGFTISNGRLPDLGENEYSGPEPGVQRSALAANTSQIPPPPRAAGLYVRGGAPRLEGLRIIDNTSESTNGNTAAGMYCENCSADLESVRFQNNTSALANGGMAVLADGESITLTLNEATFVANSATEAGGGLSFESRSGGTLDATLANLTIQDNEAGGTAAGMALGSSSTESSTTVRVANALLTGNQITDAGTSNPPVEAEGLFAFANGGGQVDLEFAQSTWRASDATRPLIGSALNAGSTLTIDNSILGGSEAPVQSENTEAQEAITINSSLVESGWTGTGADNIDAAPELTSDHRPEGNAPVIDAGDASLLPADALDLNDNGDTSEPLPVDRTGTTDRLLADDVDMGAYEGGATPRALTEPATNVGPDSTALNAIANPYSNNPVDYIFAVREAGDSNPLLTEPAEGSPLTGTSNTAITAEADGLDPQTAYEYRIEANGDGETTLGTWTSFTTEEAPPPDANDDTFEVTANASLTIDLLSLVDGLGYDIDVSSFTVVDGPSYGTVNIVSGEATYTPDEGYVGSDSFTYTVANVLGVVSAEAEVLIDVTADGPLAEDDSYTVPSGDELAVEAPGVLDNDDLGSPVAELVEWRANSSDQPFNDPVSFAGGTLTFSDDGSFVLEGDTEPGTYTAEYTIENTAGSSTASITITVEGESPVASNDSYTAQVGEVLTVEAPSVLGNDNLGNPEADLTELTVNGTAVVPGESTGLAGGTLTVEAGGLLTLDSPTEVGDAAFDYTIANAEGNSTATVTISIEEPPPPEPTPAPLSPTVVGVPGTPQQVEVNNTGEEPLTNIEAELASEEHFQITEAGPTDEVAPGESFTVALVFNPQEVGTQNTQLNIVSDGLPIAAFTLTGKALNVSIVPDSPTVGQSSVVEVRVSDNFAPSETQRLEARRGGATDYQTFQLTEAESGSWTATLPDNLVTTRGIDLFTVLSDEAGTVVAPKATEAEAAAQPQHVRVGVPTIPAQGAFAAEQYQMISVPVESQDATTGEILADTYGPYNTDRWRFFAWNPEQERYAEFPETDNIERGQAAWLITEDGAPFEVEEGQSFAANESYGLTLQPGWNQISVPFGFAVNWSEADPPESIEAPVAYQAPSAGSPPEYVYNQDQLEPWRGYFVFNSSNTSVSITVPPVAAGGDAGEAATVARSSVDPEAAAYSMQITADLEERSAQHTQTFLGFVGRNEQAHPRTFTAAPPVSPYVRTTIVDGGTHYAGHYVDTPTEGYAWNVEVEANTAGAFRTDHRVRVRLNETGTLPDNFRRYVIDLDNEQRVDVQNQAFTAVLNGSDTRRRYRIVVGTKAFAEQTSNGIPLESFETALHTNYPNPVRDATTIEYELAEPGEVTIEIYNVLGQRVRRLVDREHEAGTYTVRWDGRNDAGKRVASGPYFYRMQADGVSTARQMTVVR